MILYGIFLHIYKNKQQEKKIGVSLEKDEVQGCFDGRMAKTSREIPMRTVDDIFLEGGRC